MSSTLASGSFRAGAGLPSSARRILVVDDDRPSREGLGMALLREGHVVETAGDAWEAIVRLRAQPFDIAVVDLDLPAVHGVEFGGWDVVRIARAYQAGIAVIVLSADEDAVPAAETTLPRRRGPREAHQPAGPDGPRGRAARPGEHTRTEPADRPVEAPPGARSPRPCRTLSIWQHLASIFVAAGRRWSDNGDDDRSGGPDSRWTSTPQEAQGCPTRSHRLPG